MKRLIYLDQVKFHYLPLDIEIASAKSWLNSVVTFLTPTSIVNSIGLEDIYDALTMLPVFYDYTEKGIKGVSELALLLNNSEALINFLIYFSNKQIQ